MKGNINDWLSYRYRQRLNRGNDGSGNIDNVPTSIDYAGIGVKLDKFSFFAGKQCTAYGGIEFDVNPIDIYEYSDMIENMNNADSKQRTINTLHTIHNCMPPHK